MLSSSCYFLILLINIVLTLHSVNLISAPFIHNVSSILITRDDTGVADDENITYRIEPINYFETGLIRFQLKVSCPVEEFTLTQENTNHDKIVWTSPPLNNLTYMTESRYFVISKVTYSECGAYYAECSGIPYKPYPLQVLVPVRPVIIGVNIFDPHKKSHIINNYTASSNPRHMVYNISAYLFDDANTTLVFDVGLGRFDDEGQEETGLFTIVGLEDDKGVVTEDSIVYDPKYPVGQRREHYMTQYETVDVRGITQCISMVNASIYMSSQRSTTIYRAFLVMHYKHRPTQLTFGVDIEIDDTSEHCVLNCTTKSTCPDVTEYQMMIQDQMNRSLLYSESKNSNFIVMKLPVESCTWLANNRHFTAVCIATNEVGTARRYVSLSELHFLDDYEKRPSDGGITVAEGFLIFVILVLLISLAFNFYFYRRRCVRCLRILRSIRICQNDEEDGEQNDNGGARKQLPTVSRAVASVPAVNSGSQPQVSSPNKSRKISTLGNQRKPPTSHTSLKAYIETDEIGDANYVEPVSAKSSSAIVNQNLNNNNNNHNHNHNHLLSRIVTNPSRNGSLAHQPVQKRPSQPRYQHEDHYEDAKSSSVASQEPLPPPVIQPQHQIKRKETATSSVSGGDNQEASSGGDYLSPHYVDPTNNRFPEQRSKDF